MGSQIYIAGTSNKESILKTMKNIFAKIFVTGVMLGCVLVMPVWAAASNGCDDYDNEYISSEVALCTVHAYNIGGIANPDYSGRSEMQEVIALKTTIIAQQMYKQYEYLEAMIRRLKTQLEKATLTASLQAAGASSSDDSSSSSSWRDKDKSVYMSVGVSNCMNEFDPEKKLACYESNFNAIYTQSGNGNKTTAEIRQQLANDLKGLSETSFFTGDENCSIAEENAICKQPSKLKNNSSSTVFTNCLNEFRKCIFEKRQGYKNKQLELQSKK